MKAMWKCDGCGRRFANRNQSHFCGRYTLRGHLRGRAPEALAIYRGLAKLTRRCGRFVILPEKNANRTSGAH
jgi:transposase-like protein